MEDTKRGKADEEENADRISNLPDFVLSHILSFLPIKTAVSTSLLSPRWRHIWKKHLSVLDFSDDFFQPNDDRLELFKTLAVFVNGVFTLRKPCEVRKMRLSCTHSLVDHKVCTYSVNTWVHSVIGPHLKELDLTLYSNDDDDGGYCFEPPISLSACINIVSLSLNGAVYFNLKRAKAIRLPSLKKLQLHIGYVEVSPMNALLSGCPNLETLDLCFYAEDSGGIIRVPPSLKWLKIIINNSDAGASLEIDVPVLEYLCIANITITDANNLQNVVEASVDVFPSSAASAFTFLKVLSALTGIKHLVLSRSTTKWLLGGPTDLHFPEFRHLLHLELILPWFNSYSLLSLLQTCHLLQVLIIQNDKDQSPLPICATQPSVPSCLVSHLASIELKGYRGFPDELLFAEYVLQKGLVLKTMIIVDISVDPNKKFDTLRRLSNVPRASANCQLTFD
ncbi:F-box/FBD/LRR-repeat protein At4g26340-like [Trifolium pratense]|uniref:F-box/FBD/LRR-repeat protein At4g26340-like n=1 Tax=Trifolium pratense TaxID=57577 RepID=UPI001E691509|nr:F-box/FBD/LRR-repeat protein At4g26340-like [Trifolium pratense]